MPRDVQRLSPLDASFLYFERPHQLMHVGCIALLDGPVPFDDFLIAMDERLGSLRRYRQRPVRPFLDLDWPHWEDDPDFDIRRHVHRVVVEPPGGERELHELVDALFAKPCDQRHPLWENYLIKGLADGRGAVLCKVHHSMIDGVSGAQVLEAMSDRGAASAPRPNGHAPAARSTLRDLLASLPGPGMLVSGARNAFEAASTIGTLVREPISMLPFNGQLSGARRIVWTPFSLDDFLAMRGAAGCKVNDVILAVIAGALRRYLQAHGVRPEDVRVRTLVPVSMRRPEDHLTLGNQVAAMLPTLPVGVADPLERLRTMAEEMRRLKERGQARVSALAMTVTGALPAPFGALLGRVLPDQAFINTVCTNVPGPRDVCHLLGRRILEVHPFVPLFQPMGLEFAILSYAGQVSISAAVDPHLVPDAERIRDDLVSAAAELRSALGVGPALRTVAHAEVAHAEVDGPRVSDLMTSEVLTLMAEDSLAKAHHLMQEHRIRHVPVLGRDGRLVGIVTHRDLMAASSSSLTFTEEDRVRLLGWACAGDVMETHLSVATPDEPAAEAGERMIRHKIGCLPVLGRDDRLTGIVTEEDFLRWATARMRPEPRLAARVA